MDGIGFLVAIASFIMAIVALNKFSRIDTRIAQLKLQLGQLTDELNRLRAGAPISPAPEAPLAGFPHVFHHWRVGCPHCFASVHQPAG